MREVKLPMNGVLVNVDLELVEGNEQQEAQGASFLSQELAWKLPVAGPEPCPPESTWKGGWSG